jgi:hypothetical protein
MILTRRFAFLIVPLAVLLLAGCKPDKGCMKTCMARYKCDVSFENNPHVLGGECLVDQNECQAQCGISPNTDSEETTNRIPTTLPLLVETKTGPYGAIAYDQTSGAWGMSSPSADKAAAAKSALGFCTQHGPGCVVVDNFVNACAAIASGPPDIVTWAHAATLPAARAKAETDCVKRVNDACEIKFGGCYREDKSPKAEGNNGVQVILPPSEQ